MKGDTLGEVIRRIGRSIALQSDLALTDAQLLERFVQRRDELAFAALVVRHGPMVLGVCRRLVRDAQEAEDAFQATFLVLARKAAAVQRQPLLAGWLYGVAYRVATRLRGQSIRRRLREQSGVEATALAAVDAGADPDVRPLVHEEVNRLPDKYRSAVVLCYLEGKTNEEAALQLRWPVGSVKSRLSRARELLRTRLTRRGVTLSAGLLATALVVNKTPASPALADATIRGAALYAAGDAAAGGLISARAVGLSYGVLRTMLLTKAKIVIALALSLAMLGGAGELAYRSLAAGADDGPKTAPAKTASHDADRPKADTDAEKIQGTWRVVSAEQGGNEAPAEAIKDFTVVVTADKIAFSPKGENRQSSYKLDPKADPKVIEVTPLDGPAKGKTLRGLYALEGDRLKLCLQNGPGPEPTEFATKSDSGLRLLVLKREAADKDKPKEEKPKEGESQKDAEAIQGVWRVTAVETEGKERDDDRADRIKSQVWTIKPDKIFIKVGTIDQKVGCPYKIDPTKKPKTIDITEQSVGGDGEVKSEYKRRAIYSLEGDVLKICYGMSAPEIKHDDQNVGRRPRAFDLRDLTADGGRPTQLATKEGSRSTLVTLKREPAGKDKDVCAWGKVVKSLQAGLCIRPAEKDSYTIGQTATFVVKVRNVSDKPVVFRYDEARPADQRISPSVLDADSKRVGLSGPIYLGGQLVIVEKAIGAGEEIELALPTLIMAPVAEPRATEKTMAHVKPGKYKVSYYVNYVNPDDTGNYLTTGQAEITVSAKK